MPAQSQKLTFQVAAESDQAKKALDQLERQAKILEKGVEVPLTLEGAKEASDDLGKAAAEAKALATILQHTEGMGNVAEDAQRSAKELEVMAREAKKVESALKEISDVPPPDPKVGDASAQMDTLNRSATGAKSAMANLVGNTAQDFSGLLGPLGSVGVAIGQVAEYTADAANEGGGLTAALKGAASMVGPLAALALGSLAVTNVLERQKKEAEADKKAVEDLTDAFDDGTGILEDWGAALDDAFKAGTLDRAGTLTKFLKDGIGDENVQKAAEAFGVLNLNLDKLGPTLAAADQDFRSMAEIQLGDMGFDPEVARRIAGAVDSAEDMRGIMAELTGAEVRFNIGDLVPPEGIERARSAAEALEKIQDIVDHTDVEKSSKQWLDRVRSVKEYTQVVDDARASTASEAQAASEVQQKIEEQTRAKEENARATEEGARLSQESGTILDQVGRQVTKAEEEMTRATEENTKAQEEWAGKVLELPGAVDSFASSVLNLADGIKAQAKAGEEGAGSFEGYTKAAIDNRDAQRDVFASAKDVIDTMGKQGASTETLAAKTKEMADQAYNLAIQNGLSEDQAAALRDTILTVPTSRTTEMTYAEQNYGTMLDHRDTLSEDIHSDVWFQGHVDAPLQRAIDQFFNTPGVTITPNAAGGPSVASRGLGGPVVAPMASPGHLGAVSAPSVTVNVSAGIVADTFQLQRAVARSARSFQRLAGKRAA